MDKDWILIFYKNINVVPFNLAAKYVIFQKVNQKNGFGSHAVHVKTSQWF